MDSTILQHPYVSLSFAFNSFFLCNKKDPKNRPTKRSDLMPSNPILLEVKKKTSLQKKNPNPTPTFQVSPVFCVVATLVAQALSGYLVEVNDSWHS